jgi:hypothetical protein
MRFLLAAIVLTLSTSCAVAKPTTVKPAAAGYLFCGTYAEGRSCVTCGAGKTMGKFHCVDDCKARECRPK